MIWTDGAAAVVAGEIGTGEAATNAMAGVGGMDMTTGTEIAAMTSATAEEAGMTGTMGTAAGTEAAATVTETAAVSLLRRQSGSPPNRATIVLHRS